MESEWYARGYSRISGLELRESQSNSPEALHRYLTLLKELSVACPQITGKDEEALWLLRLRALTDNPETFATTLAEIMASGRERVVQLCWLFRTSVRNNQKYVP